MRPLLPLAAAAAMAASLLTHAPASAATDDAKFDRWTYSRDFAKGSSSGLSAGTGKMTLGKGTKRYSYKDPRVGGSKRAYDRGIWTSPWTTTGFPATSLIPSWSITTPKGTWARIDVRVRSGKTTGSWDTVARWATDTTHIKRASYGAQTDDLARLNVDTVLANKGKSFDRWQVRVLLFKTAGSKTSPTLHAVNAVAANYTMRNLKNTSTTTMTKQVDLAVPAYSQMTHKGQNKEYDGGGTAWCSPTSTSMVMRYFGKGPKAKDYAWSPYREAWVNHAARYTYDYEFGGTGNWPFTAAYAAGYSLDTFVTRLGNLRQAEEFIKAGIPLVASIGYSNGYLTGAPLKNVPGHLLVIRGFTKDGRVIVNDPAAPANSSVRRIYSRAQFEKIWLKASGGVVYVIRPTSVDLPRDTKRW
jgi:hypothetical protein